MRRLAAFLMLGCSIVGCTTEEISALPHDAGPPDAELPDAAPPDAGPDAAPDAGPPPFPTTFVPTATGHAGGAATVDVRATFVAMEVLKSGGNAVDAAVAAASVLGVTDPFSCGIGGGGFMVIYLAGKSQVVTIDHREKAPAAFSAALFYENGVLIPFAELVTSGFSAGVPGTVRGWDEALTRYGSRSLKDVLPRAIQVAEEGFDVDQTFFDQTDRNKARFKAFTSTSALYLTPAGEPLPVGTIFKNPEVGKTYRILSKDGVKAFYEGEIAKAIVDTLAAPPLVAGAPLKVRPGVMTLADLSNYEARLRTPVETTYRGYTIYGMGLPSSGGLTVAMTLNLLEGYDPMAFSSSDFLHFYLESTRLAYADRGAFMGDPEYVSVPVTGLLSTAYAGVRRMTISPNQGSTVAAAPGDPYPYQNDPSPLKKQPLSFESAGALDKETTHITVTDKQGNIVAYTCTIESEGGDGIVVPGYGFLLNNELTDFDMPASPSGKAANIAEPGKRPRSSISPTLVFKNGKPILALGSPGGSTIITTVLQIMVNHFDLGMPIDAALAAPRVSQRNSGNGSSSAEPDFLKTPEAAALMGLGHTFVDVGLIGAATAIRFNADGTVTVAAEPVRRGGGSALVESP